MWHGKPDQDAPGAGFGAGVPNGIWRGFMIPALRGTPDTPFPPPGPACSATGKFVDPVQGRTTDVAPPAPPDTGPAPAPRRPRPRPNPGPAAADRAEVEVTNLAAVAVAAGVAGAVAETQMRGSPATCSGT